MQLKNFIEINDSIWADIENGEINLGWIFLFYKSFDAQANPTCRWTMLLKGHVS